MSKITFKDLTPNNNVFASIDKKDFILKPELAFIYENGIVGFDYIYLPTALDVEGDVTILEKYDEKSETAFLLFDKEVGAYQLYVPFVALDKKSYFFRDDETTNFNLTMWNINRKRWILVDFRPRLVKDKRHIEDEKKSDTTIMKRTINNAINAINTAKASYHNIVAFYLINNVKNKRRGVRLTQEVIIRHDPEVCTSIEAIRCLDYESKIQVFEDIWGHKVWKDLTDTNFTEKEIELILSRIDWDSNNWK